MYIYCLCILYVSIVYIYTSNTLQFFCSMLCRIPYCTRLERLFVVSHWFAPNVNPLLMFARSSVALNGDVNGKALKL